MSKRRFPYSITGTHTSGLHAYQCSWDVWDYCAAIGEYGSFIHAAIYTQLLFSLVYHAVSENGSRAIPST